MSGKKVIPPGFRIRRGPKQAEEHQAVVRQLFGVDPLYPPLPDDMPAIEKLKIYARAGYKHYYNGTDEDFEGVWAEAFKKESKFKFLADARREKGGK